MKLITNDLIDVVALALCKAEGLKYNAKARNVLAITVPLVVRRCLRHIDTHHDDFIDGHNGKEYFEIVDEILVKVKAALRELIEEDM